ncbi:tetratricopeptide repeat protein [Bacteroides caecigallinarum]|uniref:tetratricopeptide repeat protein n=1 Tax=Bacteroides sp. ET336 TaxID=2972459 RepID=UPI0021AC8327|nr:tetratricopeptide repeat protein [Bacteroides sp. ET336]MCR8892373.1 tetratricopeptide repeat protein [Bacteroides sp. ET336]MDN0053268.1 tetratricopeptide repeat protein [Bacteroides caecigallinarum]MDN0056869.1 tetratricopeptide repeat protein [Bacteroides caecigallinarum]MDN0072313.1 tetratricopeptide repeat protein [Bacteroides caecigallinarum]
MEMQRLDEWINNPDLMGSDTLEELRSIILRYPYFQTAWLLYIKNLYLIKHPSFKDELRRGALYVADLSVLFYFVEGNSFSFPKSEYKESEKQVANDRTLDLINRFLSEIPNDKGLSSELSIPVDSVMDYSSLLLLNSAENGRKEVDNTALPLKGQALIDDFIEKSESGMLSPGNNMTDAVGNGNEKDEFSDEDLVVIDDDNNAGPVDDAMDGNAEAADETGDDNYLTETLAKIYVKQQRYDKALEIIKKLNLKYPKKNAYFADQMRFLERLIINAKSK